MALTAVEIYKHLPKTNCRKCGVPTCLAFAMKLVQKQAALDECPHVTDEAKAALEGSAAPPMVTLTIGVGERALKIGGETVLFRHEERFHNPAGLAISASAALPEDELRERIRRIEAARYDRVGFTLGADLIALQDSGGDTLARAAAVAAEESALPLILVTDDPAAMRAALEVCGSGKPLLRGATEANLAEMVALAGEYNCPLVIRAAGPEQLAELSERAAKDGADKLVLEAEASSLTAMLDAQTIIRRAAFKRVRSLGFPTLVAPCQPDPAAQMLTALAAIARYAGIVVVDLLDDEYLLPLVTARLNIFSDPQKPIQVEAGLHPVGDPTPESPVLVTTNFSLTYYLVEGDTLASKTAAYILAVDTKGTSVLTAWAAGDFTGETIAAAVEKFGLAEKISHRRLVLPGGVAVLKGKLEETSGWSVVVGPRESSALPQFFRQQGAAA